MWLLQKMKTKTYQDKIYVFLLNFQYFIKFMLLWTQLKSTLCQLYSMNKSFVIRRGSEITCIRVAWPTHLYFQKPDKFESVVRKNVGIFIVIAQREVAARVANALSAIRHLCFLIIVEPGHSVLQGASPPWKIGVPPFSPAPPQKIKNHLGPPF